MQALGNRIGEPGVVLLGVNCEGRALIRAGHVVDGLALLDEAMVAALDSRLDRSCRGASTATPSRRVTRSATSAG